MDVLQILVGQGAYFASPLSSTIALAVQHSAVICLEAKTVSTSVCSVPQNFSESAETAKTTLDQSVLGAKQGLFTKTLIRVSVMQLNTT